MRFGGKVAIVTGGASGIGRATCMRFAQDGAGVVVADLNEPQAKETAAEIEAKGGRAVAIGFDLGDEDSIRRMVDEAARLMGRIDIAVNCGVAFIHRTYDATLEEWEKSLRINVIGAGLLVKYVVPHMRKAGGGAIVHLGSISSVIAQPVHTTYSTTKGAILAMSRCQALDLAPYNIRVNAVCPGIIDTPPVQRAAREAAERGEMTIEEFYRQRGAMHILGRVGRPEEIAAAITFLASDDASFITATHLMVDGGYSAL